jgi:hypothetical protein
MALPSNTLQQVATYQESELIFLQNLCCFISTLNTQFKNFQEDEPMNNLGSTVNFDLPPRGVVTNSLVVNFQQAVQRVLSLSVDQQMSYANAFNNQQFIFNVKDYMNKFGRAAITELGTQIEANIALNLISGVVNNDPNSSNLGTLNTFSGPYRFYGDGLTSVNSFGQLANMLAAFRNYSSTKDKIKVYLSDIAVPQIVNSGLNQFVMKRNEEDSESWMVGNWQGVEFYQSNLLPIQVAGNVGVNGTTLTVLSTNDSTGANVTQITFSGAATSDASAIKSGDLLQFQDGVSGQPNMRFLTFVGHIPCAQPVQFRATANAASDGSGHVAISITPALCWQAGNQNYNLNNAIAAGMQVKALPSHHAGLVVGADAFMLGMPKLPDEVPFPTVSESDPDSGVSLRHYYGSQFGQNQRGYVRDCIFGSVLVPEYSMRIAFPLTQ